MRIGIAQINTTVGDFDGNIHKILEAATEAGTLGVDLLAYPELAICGYPPEDLLFKKSFLEMNQLYLDKCATHINGLTAIIGFVDTNGSNIYNAAAIVCDGKPAAVYHKVCLPNYGVFDEQRYFKEGSSYPTYLINGVSVGVTICEDIWVDGGPVARQARAGAEVIVNISSSPYYFGKRKLREEMLKNHAVKNGVFIVYCNLVGAQDELVFDGSSVVFDEKGRILTRGKQFENELIVLDIDHNAISKTSSGRPLSQKVISDKPFDFPKPSISVREVTALGLEAEAYTALVLGTHDYVSKNGFEKVVIGLSGGIDSSLVATIATDALGKENVIGVAMPSRYSSDASLADAKALAVNLGIRFLAFSIEDIFGSYLSTLSPQFKDTNPDVTEQNIQARIRGNLLMALSNKFGWLVLATGNKSEMAAGYTTLYGDLCGGFAIIKDVPKTMIYRLAEHRNLASGFEIIPSSVLIKAPSAELAPDQKDTDSLPAYEKLDPILMAYVEGDESIEQIINKGYDEITVKRVTALVDRSEYKRRQSPPGIKITPKAFGRDRRMPITNRFQG
jgi:NAD+ synthase (glutamine-hydrolysing)